MAHCALHAGYPRLQTQHSEYVILIAFPRQRCLRERTSLLRYTYIGCVVERGAGGSMWSQEGGRALGGGWGSNKFVKSVASLFVFCTKCC